MTQDWEGIRICQAHGAADNPTMHWNKSSKKMDLASHPAPGAVTRDWTGADFELTFWNCNDRRSVRAMIGAVEIRDVEKHIKAKGKKGNIGRDGTCLIAIPLRSP